MKYLLCSLTVVIAGALAALEGPSVYEMTEAQLLEVARSGELDDRMTACQELAHRGTAASVGVLSEMLKSKEPSVFHSALYALQNIPGAEVDAALAAAATSAVLPESARSAIAHVRAARAGKVFAMEKYAGATEALTAFPPKDAIRRGDMAAFPALVDAAAGTGPDAVRARFQLAGFPNAEADAKLMEFALGADAKKARLALGILGERRARSMMPQILALARATKDDRLRIEAFKALAQIGDAKRDLRSMLALLAEMPEEERLSGAIIRMVSREFASERKPINVIEAKFGNFKSRQVADVKLMVDSLIEAGSTEIMAGCRLVGRGGFHHDPAPGKTKELRIAYTVGGGAVQRRTVPDSTILQFCDYVLPADVAAPIIDATIEAKGALRASLAGIVSALERRGRMPGSDKVLFRPIFNGRDLDGWKQDGDFFRAENSVIVGETTAAHPCATSQYLVYGRERLGDFELRGSFRLSAAANSGIQVRSTDSTTTDTGYQADMNGKGTYVGYLFCTGQHLVGQRGCDVVLSSNGRKSVVRFAEDAEVKALYRPNDWNDIRIIAKGSVLAVWINNVRTVAVADSRPEFLPADGYISIQLHKGPPMKIEFRDLRVRTEDVALDPGLEDTLASRMEELNIGDAPSLEGCYWIWHTKAQNKDGAKVSFKAEFDLPQGEVEKSGIMFSCDDSAVFFVNGKEVARQTDGKLWFTPTVVCDHARTNLSAGRNAIQVEAANDRGCAAFIAVIEVTYKDGRIVRFPTGSRGWKASFDGGEFVEPSIVCPYGDKPYGKFKRPGEGN